MVKDLARAGLRNPVTISVAVKSKIDDRKENVTINQATPSSLSNYFLFCPSERKLGHLTHFLSNRLDSKLILFTLTCAGVDFLAELLSHLLNVEMWKRNCKTDEEDNFKVYALHGKLHQDKRTGIFNKFSRVGKGVLVCTDVAARGIDIPDLDWIVQYEPPQDPNFFIHRVGRVARAGKKGNSLTFLLPKEQPYIEFLAIKRVPLMEFENSPDSETGVKFLNCEENDKLVLQRAREVIKADRSLLVKGTTAFISFLRAYKEHRCQFIFRFTDLDLAALVEAFALLRVPKISELKDVPHLKLEEEIDTSLIELKEKSQEKARQDKMKAQRIENEKRDRERKDEQLQRRLRKEEQKREKERIEAIKRRKNLKKKKFEVKFEEWNDLANEERLYKHFKKGKLSKKQYEQKLMNFEKPSEETDERSAEEKAKKPVKKASKKTMIRARKMRARR
mmetsp:Transcript_19569/g.27525  ORF Transcript_19569/g.27525 Transcript_19569/m.27525 type:complete len:449 (+) Transcript_19569:712-2058(+)